MNRQAALDLAARGRLYPSVILHGGDDAARRAAALELARALLCEREPGERPCGTCRHCRRLAYTAAAGEEDASFHADFHVLERDLKTSTSVDGARNLLKAAQMAPFEARGQVFVVASADTLTGEAGDALLKALEEPSIRAPRNFLLLAPSQFDLLPTLRSRSLAVYLGPAAPLTEADIAPAAEDFAACLAGWRASGSAAWLLAAAGALSVAGGDWKDPRTGRPWALAAAAVARAAAAAPPAERRPLLDLAAALLEAMPWRLRGIPADRILEGLLSRHLAGRGS
ncbi:MAG TPA: hypothetical protein VHQ65_12750 [Thermoanaerobaculia bacterium]|nr:hypothetical protein [Thermoanaerobaculia bacterium]